MLDVQRYRGAENLEEIRYTRKWMWTHMILGAGMTVLFLFHQVFGWFAGAGVWYVISLLTMYGFMIERGICRVLLAMLCLGAAGAGVYFINRVFPLLQPPRLSILPHAAVPIVVGMASIVFGIQALFLLFSQRIRKAGRRGFSLW